MHYYAIVRYQEIGGLPLNRQMYCVVGMNMRQHQKISYIEPKISHRILYNLFRAQRF